MKAALWLTAMSNRVSFNKSTLMFVNFYVNITQCEGGVVTAGLSRCAETLLLHPAGNSALYRAIHQSYGVKTHSSALPKSSCTILGEDGPDPSHGTVVAQSAFRRRVLEYKAAHHYSGDRRGEAAAAGVPWALLLLPGPPYRYSHYTHSEKDQNGLTGRDFLI